MTQALLRLAGQSHHRLVRWGKIDPPEWINDR